jgi:hypothetical protein
MAQTIAEQLKELSQIKKDLEIAINGLGGEQIISNTPFKQYSSKIKVPSKPGDNTLVITNVSGGGSTEINKISGLSWGQFNENETIEIVATPFNKYVFDRWECISNNYQLDDPTKLSQTIIVGNENLEFRAYFNLDSEKPIYYSVIYNIEIRDEDNNLENVYIDERNDLVEGDNMYVYDEKIEGYTRTITFNTPTIIEPKLTYKVLFKKERKPTLTGFYYTGNSIPTSTANFKQIFDYKQQLGRDELGMYTYVFTKIDHSVSVDYISSGFPSGFDLKIIDNFDKSIIQHYEELGFGILHYASEGDKPNSDSSTITIIKNK